MMVCKEDFETRNLADFYDTPNDTHELPWTRPDRQIETTWTPVFVGLTQTPGTGTITITGTYKQDTTNKVVNIQAEITITGNATTSSGPSTMSLPINSVSAGTYRFMDSQGVLLGTSSSAGVVSTIIVPVWNNVNRTIIISGSYGV